MSWQDEGTSVDPDDTWDDALLDAFASAQQEAERLGRRKKKGKGGKQVLRTVRVKKKKSPRWHLEEPHSSHRRAESPPVNSGAPYSQSGPRAKSPDPSMFRKEVTSRSQMKRLVGEADPFYPNDLNTMRFSRFQHHDTTMKQVAINLSIILVNKESKLFRAICSEMNSSLYAKLAAALLCVLNERAMDLLENAIWWLVDNTREKELLFRVDSLGVALMNIALKKMGLEYLKLLLRPVIKHVFRLKGSSEVDPARFPKGEDTTAALAAAATHLRQGCECFLDTFTKTVDEIPLGIRRILWCIVRAVQQRYEGMTVAGCLSGTFFLRFVCPILVDPEKHGLISPIEGPTLGPNHRRSLLLISKVIQALANHVLFGDKEPFMSPMNSFLANNFTVCDDVLEKLSSSSWVDVPFEFVGFEDVTRVEQQKAEKTMVRIVADMQEDLCAYFVKHNEMMALSAFSAAMNPTTIFPSPVDPLHELVPQKTRPPGPTSAHSCLVGNLDMPRASAALFRNDSSATLFEELIEESEDGDTAKLGGSIRPLYRPTSFSAMPVVDDVLPPSVDGVGDSVHSAHKPTRRDTIPSFEADKDSTNSSQPSPQRMDFSDVEYTMYQPLGGSQRGRDALSPSIQRMLLPYAAEIVSVVANSTGDVISDVLSVLGRVYQSSESVISFPKGCVTTRVEPPSPAKSHAGTPSVINCSLQQKVEDADARWAFLERRVSAYEKKHERLKQQLVLSERINTELKATAAELSVSHRHSDRVEIENQRILKESEKLRQKVELFEQLNGELKQALEVQRQVVVDLRIRLSSMETAAEHTTFECTSVLPSSNRMATTVKKPGKISRSVESLLRINPVESNPNPKTQPTHTSDASSASWDVSYRTVPRNRQREVGADGRNSFRSLMASKPSSPASMLKGDRKTVIASLKAMVEHLRDVARSPLVIKDTADPTHSHSLPTQEAADVFEIFFPKEWFTPRERELAGAAGGVATRGQRSGSVLLAAWEEPPAPPSRPPSSTSFLPASEPTGAAEESLHEETFRSWSVPRVCDWFESLGLGQYCPVLRANGLSGAVLAGLSSDDLKEYGFASLGHRKRLQKALREELADSVKLQVTFEEEKTIVLRVATRVLGTTPSTEVALIESRAEFYDQLSALLDIAGKRS